MVKFHLNSCLANILVDPSLNRCPNILKFNSHNRIKCRPLSVFPANKQPNNHLLLLDRHRLLGDRKFQQFSSLKVFILLGLQDLKECLCPEIPMEWFNAVKLLLALDIHNLVKDIVD